MNKYYITFGQKYRHQSHPVFPGAHPDSVIQINAPDEETAKKMAFASLGQEWSMLREGEPDLEHFPNGVIAVWSAT